MSIVAAVNLAPHLLRRMKSLLSSEKIAVLNSAVELDPILEKHDIDLVILGRDFPDPVQLVQKVFVRDKMISTIIIASETELKEIQQAFLLAPLVGDQVDCVLDDESEKLFVAVQSATTRTRARRMHRQLIERANHEIVIAGTKAASEVLEVHLDTLLVHAPIGVALVDSRGRILAWNKMASELTDLTEREAIAHSLESILRFSSGASVAQICADALKNENSVSTEAEFSNPDKTSLYFEVTAGSLSPSAGQNFMILFHDITQQKQALIDLMAAKNAAEEAKQLIERTARDLAAEKEKFDTLVLESFSAIALMRGPELVFEIVNKKWMELVSPREYINRRYVDVYPELVDSPAHKSLQNIFVTGTRFEANEMKLNVISPDGVLEDQYFDYTNVRIVDGSGEPYGVYCNASNVTARVRARIELEEAKLEAERANLTKTFFLANMSHEIRTPLGAILGFTDLLKDRNLSSTEREQFLDTISRNGKGLTRIIDDILDLAKVESGKLEIEIIEFSFFDLLDEVTDLFRERTKAKGLYLRLNVDERIPNRICSDPTRLRQMFINIIGNAVKFTSQGGITVQVKAESSDQKQFDFYVSIRDTGIGIQPDQLERLFQPFSQADNTTSRKYGGTGLGLVLSGRLAKALGGRITIDESVEGDGSLFVVKFPALIAKSGFQKNVATIETESARQGLALENVRVLVADDSPDNLFLIRRMLQKQGAVVEMANNGREAYEFARAKDFDVVLMDIQMPELDGHQATRMLRSEGYKKTIIALTAHAMIEEKIKTQESGCDGHVTKPINSAELIQEIQQCLKR